jgi:general secretion pathway protein M
MSTTMAAGNDIKTRFYDQVEVLKARFMALQPRERVIVAVGMILVVCTAVYTLGIAPLNKAVNDRTTRIAQKQQDLAWMQGVAAQLSVLNSAQPSMNSSGESMVVLIANSASSGNVASALTGQTPDGSNGVRVRFEGVQFDALVVWLGALQKQYGIRVKSADISRTAQPGQVSATLALTRGV